MPARAHVRQSSLFEGPGALRVRVLGSSSAGNATLVWNDEGAVMIDCGFGPRYLEKSLRQLGLGFSSLTACLFTHVHSDHVNELTVGALTDAGVRMLCPAPIRRHLLRIYPALRRTAEEGLFHAFRNGEATAGSFGLETFEVPHDSPGGCFGFSVYAGDTKATMATDLGFSEEPLVDRFADSSVIVIESNHDPDMLQNSGRPEWLKRRIRERGHLSNQQCAEFITQVVRRSRTLPRAIVLAHISQECNTNPLAVGTTSGALAGIGADVPVKESFMAAPSDIVTA